MLGKQLIQAASGSAAAGGALYVDDVFSTFLYAGSPSAQTITNGIDLSTEGGMVWLKSRNNTYSHALMDSGRSWSGWLESNNNNASAGSTYISANTDGFTINFGGLFFNSDPYDFTSWSFRKAPGFFDVVTWTGSGGNRNVSHNIGSVPGCIILKRTDISESKEWIVYHRSAGGSLNFLKLNSSAAMFGDSGIFPSNTLPTSTQFSVSADFNASGGTYVAYIFAHDDQSFGTNSDEAIIKCGSFSGSIGNGGFVDLGFEPQWVMAKRVDSTSDWVMCDIMRGATDSYTSTVRLKANKTDAEDSFRCIFPQPTGFLQYVEGASAATMIYIAIRRPHKPPTAGTDVFAVAAAAGNSDVTTNFPVDLAFQLRRSAGSKAALTRLQGKATLELRNTSAESINANAWYESNTKFLNAGLFTADSAFHLFKRAPGFMDVVAEGITGSSTNVRVNHNLGVLPELIIAKRTSAINNWYAYSSSLGRDNFLVPNTDTATNPLANSWGTSDPTATDFGWNALWLGNGSHVYYLFATLPGISKVGSYTGTGNAINVDCGFSAGARFILIKRTDSTGDWYVYDSARGIVSGNDPYILIPAGSSSDEVTNTDYIDPLSSGFTVTSSAPTSLNASGGTYIFLAIA